MLPELCYQHLYVIAANLLIFHDIEKISAGKFHFSRYTDFTSRASQKCLLIEK